LHLQQPAGKYPSDAIQTAWVAIQQVALRQQDAVETKLKAAGLPGLAWYSLLWQVERATAPIRQRDLGETLFLPRYAISRQLDRMEEEGLVKRENCPEDARGQFITLTPEGRALRKKMWAIHGPAMAEAMAGLSNKEAEALSDALKKLG
jgi:DNA-binding MarR family transcriptional regulator